MEATTNLIPHQKSRARLARLFALEILGSVGGTLTMLGIFFYMQTQFGWGAKRNLLLSAAQGLIYVVGALAASGFARRLGNRPYLRLVNVFMIALPLAAVIDPSEAVVVIVLCGYTFCLASQWPIIESLVSAAASPHELSRRISFYNLLWSATGAISMACTGLMISHFPPGVFLATTLAHVISLIILLRHENDPSSQHTAAKPEPELIPMRTLAMNLSRVALPATYAVIYGLGALMPTLAILAPFSSTMRTVLASAWMAARFAAFFLLGRSAWWHTRPRSLLLAAFVLLLAFLGITFQSSIVFMILWQIALGFCVGFIYAGSLYFGMVLSDGSAEHGGYHEALIGLGSILGPGCGAMAEEFFPGDQRASVLAVAFVLWISAMLAMVVSLQSTRKRSE